MTTFSTKAEANTLIKALKARGYTADLQVSKGGRQHYGYGLSSATVKPTTYYVWSSITEQYRYGTYVILDSLGLLSNDVSWAIRQEPQYQADYEAILGKPLSAT